MQEFIDEQINEIKDKIKEIYYIQEYDKAQEFEKILSQIEQKDSLIIGDPDAFGNFMAKQAIQKELTMLSNQMEQYMQEQGRFKQTNLMQRNFSRKVKEFVQNSGGKTSEELLLELEKMVIEAKALDEEGTLTAKLDELSAKALFHVFIQQIKAGEPIDLSIVRELSTPEYLANEIQNKVIEIAKEQDEGTAFDMLNLCKQLGENILQEKKIWEILSGSTLVKFKDEEMEQEKEDEGVFPVLKLKKTSVFSNLKKRLFGNEGTTQYVFGKLNPNTNEYENVEVEFHSFPPKGKLLKKCEQSCIRLEINDQEVVEMGDVEQMPYLNALTFGRNVRIITRETAEGQKPLVFLQQIKFSDDVEKLEGFLFNESSALVKIEFGKNIQKIGDGCFCHCDALTTVAFPDSLRKIGRCAFGECKNLQKVVFGKKLKKIDGFAFQKCERFVHVELPDSLKSLGESAFRYDKGLQTIKFGKSLKEIGENCFLECYNLQNIELPSSLEKIGKNAFNFIKPNQENTPIVIPKNVSSKKLAKAFRDETYLNIDGKIYVTSYDGLMKKDKFKKQMKHKHTYLPKRQTNPEIQ